VESGWQEALEHLGAASVSSDAAVEGVSFLYLALSACKRELMDVYHPPRLSTDETTANVDHAGAASSTMRAACVSSDAAVEGVSFLSLLLLLVLGDSRFEVVDSKG
jgi:hypothetical protein